MAITKILYGHTSRKTAIVIIKKNKRQQQTTRFCWIETKPGKGDRLGWVFSYPNTAQQSKPYYKKFAALAFLYVDEEGKIQDESIAFDDSSKSNKEKFVELMTKMDPAQLSSEQQYTIRKKIYEVFLSNAKAELTMLTGKQYDDDWSWTQKTLNHIENCPFQDIGNYPDFQVPLNWPILTSLRYDSTEDPVYIEEAE
ncbi:hypothetical protein [Puia dinghuensis]|uniref:Uncharacterized protein n=1 Tax=Puia dinghuensis TaxID=1792502 RepID=A0A8J2UB91_9BACT|nr:hypothetical protein [Puia dinghuensis]GGA92872.1 hypothetical protein GCM10011511_15340 [Puia dinghuensis]